MSITDAHAVPPALSRSRAKLWIRTGILAVFGTLFSVSLARDMTAGTLNWAGALTAFLACLPIGFWMRRLVPMQVHLRSHHITFSFDRVYFALILALVVAKAVTAKLPGMAVWSDGLMCVILGLMVGRLSGICLRVRGLKLQHHWR
jgi:hypothetical protein